MPTFQNVISSIQNPQANHQRRQEIIKKVQDITQRPLLVYVANPNSPDSIIRGEDKTGFSDLIQDVQSTQVDIMINSPGGFAEVSESLVTMLRSKFEIIRFAIPNMAKSAATLLCMSGNELMMDHRSELGPIDPQVEYPADGGRRREAAEDIVDGFAEIKKIIEREGPAATPAYIPLLSKYTLGLLRSCENAKELSKKLAEIWLHKYMFSGQGGTEAKEIAEFLASHKKTLSHGRAIGVDVCLEKKLKILDLRNEPNLLLGSLLWELWCLYERHFEASPVHKVYENAYGCLLQKASAQMQLRVPQQIPIPHPIQPQQNSQLVI
jgi:hypothetical protein